MKRFILQAATEEEHVSAVQELLSLGAPLRVVLGVAFMNEAGIELIRAQLEQVAEVTQIFVGIRNGITTAQGLMAARGLGCTVYTVDTGTRSRIFHPKVYLSMNDVEARLISGSANLTAGGLNRNIEGSVYEHLLLDADNNGQFVADIASKFDEMQREYPNNVIEIANDEQVQALLEAGRVADETVAPPPEPKGRSGNRDADITPRMALKTNLATRPRRIRTRPAIEAPEPADGATISASTRDRLDLIWESKPLTRRYLTIPTGGNTNPTGSMLFTKGTLEDIDQRHYFRDEVFNTLEWHFDDAPGREHMERANARFRLIIRDIDYGIFDLRLSHNSRTDTKAYEQRNSMTQLHWGDARQHVAREDLLDRTLRLYRDRNDQRLFVMEVD